jgi:hypothetical protein
MKTFLLFALMCVSCGSPQTSKVSPTLVTSNEASTIPTADSPALKVCKNIARLNAEGCPSTANMRSGFEVIDTCVSLLDSVDPSSYRELGSCYDLPCAKAGACIAAYNQARRSEFRECADDGGGFVGLSPAELAASYGFGAAHFADVKTSKAQPIEVCDSGGQAEWLRKVTCADGSNPFGSRLDVANARVGNVGAGGRCNSIIDLYQVPCPETTYKIYMDMYMCPKTK